MSFTEHEPTAFSSGRPETYRARRRAAVIATLGSLALLTGALSFAAARPGPVPGGGRLTLRPGAVPATTPPTTSAPRPVTTTTYDARRLGALAGPVAAWTDPTTTTSVPRRRHVTPPTTAAPVPTAPDGPDYHGWWDWPIWHCIGVHEQGNAADPDGIAWAGQSIGGLPGSAYPGGLGISRPAWADAVAAGVPVEYDRHGVAHVVTNGAWAAPATQIRVGRWLVAKYGGYGGWATHGICGV